MQSTFSTTQTIRTVASSAQTGTAPSAPIELDASLLKHVAGGASPSAAARATPLGKSLKSPHGNW
jgi:hypothetical protein